MQRKLRQTLYTSFRAAVSEERNPTAQEIATFRVPYLDAVIEEMLRCSGTAAGLFRIATQDTTVLGYHIPKGIDVLCMSNGPGFVTPHLPVEIDEEKRSPSSRAARVKGGQAGEWDSQSTTMFEPDRWLKSDEKLGELEFDPKAGPTFPFGLGPRGCFGTFLRRTRRVKGGGVCMCMLY